MRDQDREATEQERQALASWRSWGALPGLFSEDSAQADELRALLTPQEWRAARRSTVNAHYTDPSLARVIWQAVTDLGFDGGRVLEPGCGSGVFLEAAPPGLPIQVTGVELDPVSAEIAQRLHPEAEIRAESFTQTPHPSGTFDLTIGNVPFADVRLYDPRHNAGNHCLHNYFLLKSLDLTRPGALVAVLTSRYTMDATDPSARAAMYATADLVAAVRLPTGAHRSFAGTDAVTDLVILRRRLPGETPGDDTWLHSDPSRPDLPGTPMNRWWDTHPDAVLGHVRVGNGMYGDATLVVHGELTDLAASLRDATSRQSSVSPLRVVPTPRAEGEPPPVSVPVARLGDATRFEGHLTRQRAGEWSQLRGGIQAPFDVPASREPELAGLVGLRDRVIDVLTLEAATREDTPELQRARTTLRRAYQDYVSRYGPINRVTITQTQRIDKTGEPIIMRRYPPAVRLFREDPHSATVRALERYDETTGTAQTAAILHHRVLAPRPVRDLTDSPADALAICLDTHGRVDLDTIASLLSVDADTARRNLGTLVFDEPGTGRLVSAPEYLSGNVRATLAAAEAAAVDDPRFEVNTDALRRAVPADLGPQDITATLGAVWIPASDVRDFLQQTLRDRTLDVEHVGGSNWKVRGGQRWSPAATGTWGTDRISGHEIAEHLMRQQRIVVHDIIQDPQGRDVLVVNPVATEAAQDKAHALQERFGQWIWADPERAVRLARIYNDTFNALVLRSYDAEGQRLRLPGLAANFEPHPHQRGAVARIIGEPSVGLFHAVGAGKTAEMVIGATELGRLGLVTKPAVIVPNHMLEQFTREWLQLYPAANVLAAASEDLRGQGRRTFIARAATGDWDGIILTHSAFGSIPVSLEGQRRYLDAQIQTRRDQLDRAKATGVSNTSVKQLEKTILREEQRLTRLLDHKVDPGLTWEQTGIDYLCIDELHLFKNLTIASNIQDVARDGSIRATDLDMKIALLREAAGPRGRVVTGATATPIANTMAEAYVMQHYLRPDLLVDAGLTDFDAWAATFGRTVSKVEMRPAGDGFRVKDRFASFQNLPEMLLMWHVPADVKTDKDLALPVPLIARDRHGRRTPEIVVIPLSEAQQDFMSELKERAEKIHTRQVRPYEDNMLKVSGDGRKAGLDLRLLGRPAAAAADDALVPEPTKIDVAAERIHRIWAEHRHDTLPGRDRAGALQIAFCDLGTPSPDRWNVYDALREALTGHGMDPRRIRFVHEAKDAAGQARLFAQCRSGDVDVMIGSTPKMGVGTNIQDRAIALHHLDCPWRPADVEQREGRILRQGNTYPEIQVLRYVTQGSFDGYMWQGVARKASFIDQVMHGRLDQRTAADLDLDGEQFDYATVTAVASGNPLLLERATVQADVEKLMRLESAHARAQQVLARTIFDLDRQLETLTQLEPKLHAAIAARTPTAADAFSAVIAGMAFTHRTEANSAILDAVSAHAGGDARQVTLPRVVQLGGHAFEITVAKHGNHLLVGARLRGLDDHINFQVPVENVGVGGHGLVTRVENLLHGLDRSLENTHSRIHLARQDRDEARRNYGAEFPRRRELSVALARLDALEKTLNHHADASPPPGAQDPDALDRAVATAASTVTSRRDSPAQFAGSPSVSPSVRP